MATKVFTTDLRIGMFVADLDRPWVDTPFLLQGFVIEDEAHIRELQEHCLWVTVDRARSTGDEYEAPPTTTNTIPPKRLTAQQIEALARLEGRTEPQPKKKSAPPPREDGKPGQGRVINLEDVLSKGGPGAARPHVPHRPGTPEADGEG